MNRADSFARIEKEYIDYDTKRVLEGKFLEKTSLGYYGVASVGTLFSLFSEINLGQFKSFVDLGSGDGRAVFIASLFTSARGIEIDSGLINISKEIGVKTGVFAKFLCKDFETIDLSEFDVLFINPDKAFYQIEKKLRAEMKPEARLVVFNSLYRPLNLKLEKELNVDRIGVGVYSNN